MLHSYHCQSRCSALYLSGSWLSLFSTFSIDSPFNLASNYQKARLLPGYLNDIIMDSTTVSTQTHVITITPGKDTSTISAAQQTHNPFNLHGWHEHWNSAASFPFWIVTTILPVIIFAYTAHLFYICWIKHQAHRRVAERSNSQPSSNDIDLVDLSPREDNNPIGARHSYIHDYVKQDSAHERAQRKRVQSAKKSEEQFEDVNLDRGEPSGRKRS
jgi:hypothetical protein